MCRIGWSASALRLRGTRMIARSLSTIAVVAVFGLTTAFGGTEHSGLPSGPATNAATRDALDVLATSMTAGTWQKLHDDVSQTGGIRDVLPAQNTATFAINHKGNDWIADWSPWPWSGRDGRTIIRSWNGGALVDKSGHVRFYIPGAGGHWNYGGNEVYSFDLLAAAAALYRGSRQGTEQWWQRVTTPARLGQVHDGTNYNRPFNAKGPYTHNHSTVANGDPQRVQWVPFNPDDPFGDDQCNIGPPSTHLYGGAVYHPFYDAIVVYGSGAFGPGGTSPRGIWLFDIPDQEWKLLPADRDLTAPYDCSGATAGDLLFEAIRSTSTSNHSIIMYADERMWIGNRWNSYRWRTDDVAWTVSPQAGVNNHAQKTGNSTTHSKPFLLQGVEERSIAAPYNGNLAAWIFYEDDGLGGTPGWALIWPDIDQDDNTTATRTDVDYANNMPHANGEFLPDLTSGVYSATHNKIFFIHRPWLSDFKGQVYAFDLSTLEWETYIDPAVDPSNPSQAVDNGNGGSDNGTWGRFAYMENRNLFLLVFDGGASSNGYTGQVYLLKGI